MRDIGDQLRVVDQAYAPGSQNDAKDDIRNDYGLACVQRQGGKHRSAG